MGLEAVWARGKTQLVAFPAACTWAVWGFRSRKSVEVGFLDISPPPRIPCLEIESGQLSLLAADAYFAGQLISG